MKTSYKLVSAAMLGALGIGLVVASDSQAAGNDWPTKGKVEFKGADNTTSKPIYPPGKSEPEISGPIDNTEDKDLKIRNVAEPDFDIHDIVSVSGKVNNWSAKTYTAKAVSDGSDVKMPHFVRFQDLRADGEENHYTVSAALTKQFENAGTLMTGATLTYTNPSLVSVTNAATMPEISSSDVTLTPTLTLTESNGSQPLFVNKQAGKGFGTFEIMFGTYAEAESETHNDNVKLNTLADTVFKKGIYEAEITWTIAEVK